MPCTAKGLEKRKPKSYALHQGQVIKVTIRVKETKEEGGRLGKSQPSVLSEITCQQFTFKKKENFL